MAAPGTAIRFSGRRRASSPLPLSPCHGPSTALPGRSRPRRESTPSFPDTQMIHFVTLPAHRYTHDILVTSLVRDGHAVSLQDYAIAPARFCRPRDTVILCDIERFREADQERLRRYARRCGELGARVLNRPDRAMPRTKLVNALAAHGNGFRAWPASELPADARFPVFLREEFEHDGPASDLLQTRDALDEALRRYERDRRCDGEPLVVEYVDIRAPGEDRFHKYGAFVLDGAVIPRHLFFAKHWVVKRPDAQSDADLAAERDYLAHNPLAVPVAEACRRAGIDYGRVDFGARGDGSVVVFEVNTNPTVFHLEDFAPGPRLRITEAFYRAFRRSLPADPAVIEDDRGEPGDAAGERP